MSANIAGIVASLLLWLTHILEDEDRKRKLKKSMTAYIIE
jgi:hypothetical protein